MTPAPAPHPGRGSVSQKRHAPGGTHFCLLRRTEIPSPWYPPGDKIER